MRPMARAVALLALVVVVLATSSAARPAQLDNVDGWLRVAHAAVHFDAGESLFVLPAAAAEDSGPADIGWALERAANVSVALHEHVCGGAPATPPGRGAVDAPGAADVVVDDSDELHIAVCSRT